MPGFMGLRGMETRKPHDLEPPRSEAERQADLAKKALKRADKIIQDQAAAPDGDGGGDTALMERPPRPPPLTAGEIMSAKVAALSFDDTVLTAHNIFARVKFRHLPIVNASGGIIGVVSDRDILRNSSPFLETVNEQNRDRELMGRKIGMIMTRTPLCVTADTPVSEAIALMNSKRISCLPIVGPDGAQLLGIITWKDVARAFCPDAFARRQVETRIIRTGANAASASARQRALAEDAARLRARADESARIRALTAESVGNPEKAAFQLPPSAASSRS